MRDLVLRLSKQGRKNRRLPNKVVLVRSGGLEPPRMLLHSDLNAARLPIPPRPHCSGLVPLSLVKALIHLKSKNA